MHVNCVSKLQINSLIASALLDLPWQYSRHGLLHVRSCSPQSVLVLVPETPAIPASLLESIVISYAYSGRTLSGLGPLARCLYQAQTPRLCFTSLIEVDLETRQ